MDKRSARVQAIKLSPSFFPLDIHKSMFINDLMITVPQYYAKTWKENIIAKHDKTNCKWNIQINYELPRKQGKTKKIFTGHLSLFFSNTRSKTSSYRIKWKNEFAIQIAKDYPKSFVRSLEYHIGDEYYKQLGFTEFDVGGFKEQLQVKIEWKNNEPIVSIKELFRVREESQSFPQVFKELSSYLIADYLLSDEKEILRRIQVHDWRPRKDIVKEVNENNIYLLINRDKKEIYIGETHKSLAKRYPKGQPHHSFDEWNEYCMIQLPPETSNHTRLLIERVLIAVSAKLFPNKLGNNSVLNVEEGLHLMNRKK